MSSLAELYAALQTAQNNDQIVFLTHKCDELHQDPAVLFQQLDILSQCDNLFVKQQAAIGMKNVLARFWKQIAVTPEAQRVKACVLDVLVKEKSQVIVDVVLTSLEPVFMDLREHPWPELLGFVEKLMGESDDNGVLMLLMKFFYMWVPAMSEQEFGGFHDGIGQLIMKAMTKGDEQLFVVAVQLFSQTVAMFQGGFSPAYVELLKMVVNAFHQALSENWGTCNVLSNWLEKVVASCNGAFDMLELVKMLLVILVDPKVNKEVAFHAFGPIEQAVVKHYKAIQGIVPDIVRVAMTVGACYLSDECFSEEISTAEYVLQVIGVLSEYCDSERLYEAVSPCLGSDSPGQTYVSILVMDIFLTNVPDVAVENAAFFATFLIRNMAPAQHHTIRETAFYAIPKLLELLGENLNDYADSMIEACLAAIECDHAQLVFLGVRALAMVLAGVCVNQKFIGGLYEKLMVVLGRAQELQTEVLSALANLINAAEDGIKPYVEPLAKLVIEAAQVSEARSPLLKARAVEALGKLLYVAPEQMQSIAAPSMQLLMSCRESKDGSVVSSVLIAMATMTSTSYPGIDEFLAAARDYALSELDLDHAKQLMESDAFDPEEEQNVNEVLIEVIANAMSVIDQLAIDKPAILAPKAEEALNAIVNLTQFENSIMREKAAGAIVSMIVAYKFNANVIVPSLEHMFTSFDPLSARAVFDMCEELVEKRVDMTPETLSAVFGFAMQGVTRKLECLECGRDEDEGDDVGEKFDMQLMKSVFGFLDALTSLGPEVFDKAKRQAFLEAVHMNAKKSRKLETVMGTRVLGGLFEHCRAEISGLQMKILLTTVVQSLTMCDGNVRPEGLIAVRRIFDSDPSVFASDVAKILEMVVKILGMENEGQAFYRKTVAAASSVLFTILRIQPGGFNMELLKPMVAVLPPRCEQANIYGSLITIFNQSKDIFGPIADVLIAGVTKTLALQDSQYKKMKLSDETSKGLVAILTYLLQTVPNAQGMMQEAAGDPVSLAKVQSRLQPTA